MALMQLIPGLGTVYGAFSTFFPVFCVIIISMIKDAFEDNKRRKSDNVENNAIAQCCPRGQRAFIDTKSLNIEVGCIVKIFENQFFPCDMLMVNSSLAKGIAFVETKNLDGETNLKQKQAHQTLQRLCPEEELTLNNLNGSQIDCEGPNASLYKFQGTIRLTDGALIPIDPD